MKLIIDFSIILLVSSVVEGIEDCVKNKNEIKFCYTPRTFIRVIEHDSRPVKIIVLKLYSHTINTFAPYAINSSHITEITVIRAKYSLGRHAYTPLLSLFSDSFIGVLGLQSLKLSIININFNNENPLAPLGLLVRLTIRRTNITEVPCEMLASVPKLEQLDLSSNHITAIRSNSFAPLKSLFELSLKRNGIAYIEPGAFNGLAELRLLVLSLNLFFILPGIFQNIPKLKHLDLSKAFDYNQTDLDIGLFDGLPELTTLSLRENTFSNMSTGVFDNLKSLKTLDLSRNWITKIPPGAFNHMNLDKLNLVQNGISVIESNTFDGLSINKLFLQNNHIEELKPGGFNGLIVGKLNLAGNGLTHIHFYDFKGCQTSNLVLADNYIKKIAKNALKTVVTEMLDLQSNPIADSISAVELGLPEQVKLIL